MMESYGRWTHLPSEQERSLSPKSCGKGGGGKLYRVKLFRAVNSAGMKKGRSVWLRTFTGMQ